MSEKGKKKQSKEGEVLEQVEETETEDLISEQDPEQEQQEETPSDTKEDEELQAKYLRLAADFQNYKRRVEKEKSDIYLFANEKFALDLLEVIDNFERAILHAEESSDKGLKEGMDMIFKQLVGVLEKNKIEEIKASGEDFDPNFHNAVMMEESADHESGKVSAVLQKGYLLNGKVIRPAMVKVSQ